MLSGSQTVEEIANLTKVNEATVSKIKQKLEEFTPEKK